MLLFFRWRTHRYMGKNEGTKNFRQCQIVSDCQFDVENVKFDSEQKSRDRLYALFKQNPTSIKIKIKRFS